MDNYDLYHKIIDTSWKCLLDNNIRALPISSIDIAKQYGIKVIKDTDAKKLSDVEFALSVYHPTKNRWAIIYDDNLSANDCRWCLAHELGHILLRHEYRLSNGMLSFTTVPKNLEYDADRFALRLLAPSCVLWGLDLHTSDEIMESCGIPERYAIKRAKRMAVLYNNNKFLTKTAEKKVFNNFKDWIEFSRKP